MHNVFQSFATDATEKLALDGYATHYGDDGTGQVGWWFSWCKHGTDVETGPTRSSELDAWLDALQHRLDNSSIPLG